MISNGVAKECARSILPLSTQTRLFMNGTLRSWIHYLQLRCDPGTQFEHREIADAIKQIFCKEFPVIGEAVFSTDPTTN
jgi:thymidylate synthase (FAD)